MHGSFIIMHLENRYKVKFHLMTTISHYLHLPVQFKHAGLISLVQKSLIFKCLIFLQTQICTFSNETVLIIT